MLKKNKNKILTYYKKNTVDFIIIFIHGEHHNIENNSIVTKLYAWNKQELAFPTGLLIVYRIFENKSFPVAYHVCTKYNIDPIQIHTTKYFG